GEELELRRRVGLPPIKRMARVVCRDPDLNKAETEARRLVERLHKSRSEQGLSVQIMGPAPAPIARIGDHWRQQVEILAEDARALQQLIGSLRRSGLLQSDARTAIDVDPVSLL
ncbi:MAG: hypothetical protein R3236_02550, partial [Phycisphaeraceae bacterium]|nr:hypothetical protein [Phycisphaeraceae bacterium]